MCILYKPDFEETKERYLAWWHNEDFGRCALSITSPKAGAGHEKPPAYPDKVEDRWLDLDYINRYNEYWHNRTFYGGEAMPLWCAGYPGWDFIPAYLGSEVDLMEDTGWVYPIIEEGELTDYDYNDIVIRPDNRWWIFAEKVHRFAAEKAKGECLAGIQAIGGSGDILACIRSTEKLLYDVMDHPEYVREFELYLMKLWIEVYEKFYNIIHETSQGSTAWMPLWSPGRFYVPANDFSYMISPKMFEDIFLPSIEMQLDYLDHSIYHVDGIAAFVHVDMLCGLPKLNGIQILPGTGKPSPLHYMDVLKKVQKAGKNLLLYLGSDEIEPALEMLSSKGLHIITYCDSEEEARYYLKMSEKWSKVRK